MFLSQSVHGTATYRCDGTRDCIIQFCPPDDEHMWSKHVEAWNKLIIKFSASSCLILRNNYFEIHSQQNIKKFKKSPFFAHIFNTVWFQAALELSKALLFSYSATTRKTKHPWIQISFRDGAIFAENLYHTAKTVQR